jgi:hypothetical protein
MRSERSRDLCSPLGSWATDARVLRVGLDAVARPARRLQKRTNTLGTILGRVTSSGRQATWR